MNADGLLSSILSSSDDALSRSLSTLDETRKPWDRCQWTSHLNCPVSNSLQQCPVQESRHHSYACKNMLRVWLTLLRAWLPLLWALHSFFEYHAPVVSVTPLLRGCGALILPKRTCGAFNLMDKVLLCMNFFIAIFSFALFKHEHLYVVKL